MFAQNDRLICRLISVPDTFEVQNVGGVYYTIFFLNSKCSAFPIFLAHISLVCQVDRPFSNLELFFISVLKISNYRVNESVAILPTSLAISKMYPNACSAMNAFHDIYLYALLVIYINQYEAGVAQNPIRKKCGSLQN